MDQHIQYHANEGTISWDAGIYLLPLEVVLSKLTDSKQISWINQIIIIGSFSPINVHSKAILVLWNNNSPAV